MNVTFQNTLDLEQELALIERERSIPLNPLENRQLLEALQNSIASREHIQPEIQRLRVLLEQATSDSEIAARNYQIEYVESYLTRAAVLGQKRLEHFRSLNTKPAVEKELARVKRDKKYWFEMYAWGYDPRARTPLSIVPFELFPTQKKAL